MLHRENYGIIPNNFLSRCPQLEKKKRKYQLDLVHCLRLKLVAVSTMHQQPDLKVLYRILMVVFLVQCMMKLGMVFNIKHAAMQAYVGFIVQISTRITT